MTQSQHANGAGPVTPKSDEATGGGGFRGQGRTDNGNSAASTAAAEADKTFTTLRATLAMRGFELRVVSDGGTAYLVRRWSMSCTLPDLPAVRAFAERARVPHG